MLHSSRARSTRALAALLYIATLMTLVLTTFFPEPVEGVSLALILSVKLIPLAPFVGIVFKGHNRGYIWLSFVVLFYFTQATVSSWLTRGDPGPVILAILTFLLFTVAMIHLKLNRPPEKG